VWKTGIYNALLMGLVGGLFVSFPGPIVRLFTPDPAIISLGVACLRIVSIGNIGYAYEMVMMQAFNGAGDTVTPTVLSLIGFWLIELPLAWTLAYPLHMQVRGVFASIPIAEALIALLSLAMFLRGNWKTRQI